MLPVPCLIGIAVSKSVPVGGVWPMTLFQEFHHIVQRVGETVAVPQIEEVLLPSHGKEEESRMSLDFCCWLMAALGPLYQLR